MMGSCAPATVGGMKWALLLIVAGLSGSALAASDKLTINEEQSHVDIEVKATVDSFAGSLNRYDAEVVVADAHVVSAVIRFRFGDVHTGKGGRDEAMHEWFETKKHPDGVFTLASLEPAADGRFKAHGTLLMHGVSRELVFPVAVITDRTRYAIDGVATLDTREFGLPVIRKFGLLKVDPLVKVRFHLQGAVKKSLTTQQSP
jgi:polyisoprenoid-binding protein YceI